MSPAELRALIATADQRPVTTAETIDQARAEGVLSGWRAWLPGLLAERPRDEILTAVKDAIATTPQAWHDETLGGKMDRREIDGAAENVLVALAPFIPLCPGLASCGEHVGGVTSPSAADVHLAQTGDPA